MQIDESFIFYYVSQQFLAIKPPDSRQNRPFLKTETGAVEI